jgi:hypothetical protein
MTKDHKTKPKQKTSTQRRPKRAASTEQPSGACEAAGRSAPPLLSNQATHARPQAEARLLRWVRVACSGVGRAKSGSSEILATGMEWKSDFLLFIFPMTELDEGILRIPF